MGKNKGYRSMMAVIFSALILIVMSVSVFLGTRKTIQYRISGTPVDAVVTMSSKIANTRYVEAMYYDENNRPHICETVYNGIAAVGDEFTGYVLPDVPDKLYRMPPLWLVLLAGTLFGAMIIISLVVLVKNIRIHRENKMLSIHGQATHAEIVNIQRKGRFKARCYVRFRDDTQTERFAYVTFTKSIPPENGTCKVFYYITPKGKTMCDLIEL